MIKLKKYNRKFLLFLSSFIAGGIVFTGCSVSYAENASKIANNNTNIKKIESNSYFKNYHIFTGIQCAGKTIKEILQELSDLKGKNYIYVSSYNISFPDDIDLKITNLEELKKAVEIYTPYDLSFVKKPYNTVVVIATVKSGYDLKINKTAGSLKEILQALAQTYNAKLIIKDGTFSSKELNSSEHYVIFNNKAFELMKAIKARHNVFIDYNPYNKELKVYKYKIITKFIPGLNKKEIETSLNKVLNYDKNLKEDNSYYIDKNGIITVKTTYLNYYAVLNFLNTLKHNNMKNVDVEFDYFKVETLDKIPFVKLKNEILNCGNFECLKSVLENYGMVETWERENATSKIGKKGIILFTKDKDNNTEFVYKIETSDVKGNNFSIDYSLYNRKKEFAFVKSSLNAKRFTYVPVFIKRNKLSNGFYLNYYYILKISNSIF